MPLAPAIKFWGTNFANERQFLAWLGILVIAILSMTSRTVFSGALEGTALTNLDATEVLVILLGYYVIILYLCRDLPKQPISPINQIEPYLIYFISAMTLTLILSLFISPTTIYDPIHALVMYRKCIISIIGGYFITKYIVTDNNKVKPVLITFFIIVLLISYAICTGRVTNLVDPKFTEVGAAFGSIELPLNNNIVLGGNTASLYLLMFAFIGFSFLLNSRGPIKKVLFSIIVLATCAGILFLGTRATTVFLPLGYGFIFALTFFNLNRAAVIKLLICGVIVLALMYLIFSQFDFVLSRLPQFQQEKLGALMPGGDALEENTFIIRLEQYKAFLETILTNPFGYGLMGIYPQFRITPHSLILRLLLISGWLGFICYYIFIIKMTWYWYGMINRVDKFAKSLLIGMITMNVTLISLSWGYDFIGRFDIQLTYFVICGLAMAVAKPDALRRG